MLEAEHITFSYRNRTPVLKDVSFRLGRGECMCLLGPNGVGKTTLLRCLLNGQKPSSGKITLDSQEIYSQWEDCSKQVLCHAGFSVAMP